MVLVRLFTVAVCISAVCCQIGGLNELMTLQALDIDIPEHAIHNAIHGRGGGVSSLLGGGADGGLQILRRNRMNRFSTRQTQLPVNSFNQNAGLAQQLPATNVGFLENNAASNSLGFNQFSQQSNSLGNVGQNTFQQQQQSPQLLQQQQQQQLSFNSGLGGQQQLNNIPSARSLSGNQPQVGGNFGQGGIQTLSSNFGSRQNNNVMQRSRQQFQSNFGTGNSNMGGFNRGMQGGNQRMFRG